MNYTNQFDGGPHGRRHKLRSVVDHCDPNRQILSALNARVEKQKRALSPRWRYLL